MFSVLSLCCHEFQGAEPTMAELLTEKKIRAALAAGVEKRTILWDSGVSGLGLEAVHHRLGVLGVRVPANPPSVARRRRRSALGKYPTL